MSVHDGSRGVSDPRDPQSIDPGDGRRQPALGISASVDHVGRREVATVAVSGRLCEDNAAALRRLLDALIDDGITHVHVDLSGLHSCTVVDITVLVDSRRRLEERHGTLRVTGSDGGGRTVADLLRMYAVDLRGGWQG